MKTTRKTTQNVGAPLVMPEDYWANSMLSVARYYGRIKFQGCEYWIVDKKGRDIFECSAIAEKEGREKAIEPGEPADLCRKDFIPVYRALGRDRVVQLLKEGKGKEEIESIAGIAHKKKSQKTRKK